MKVTIVSLDFRLVISSEWRESSVLFLITVWSSPFMWIQLTIWTLKYRNHTSSWDLTRSTENWSPNSFNSWCKTDKHKFFVFKRAMNSADRLFKCYRRAEGSYPVWQFLRISKHWTFGFFLALKSPSLWWNRSASDLSQVYMKSTLL